MLLLLFYPPETRPTSLVPTAEDVAIWKRMHRDITRAQGHEIAVSLQLLLSLSPPQKHGGGNYRQSRTDENIHFVLLCIISACDSLSAVLMNCPPQKRAA